MSEEEEATHGDIVERIAAVETRQNDHITNVTSWIAESREDRKAIREGMGEVKVGLADIRGDLRAIKSASAAVIVVVGAVWGIIQLGWNWIKGN